MLEEFLNQVSVAAENGLYFIALAGALVIPDICGALERQNGKSSSNTYKRWYDTNMGRRPEGALDSESCYYFRCSLLHQGNTQHSESNFERIIFVEPSVTNLELHMNIFKIGDRRPVMNIDVKLFTLAMVQAAREWMSKKEGSEPYERNIRQFVTRHPNGLSPYISGIPVIS